MPERRKKLFCELGPTCYAISSQKEVCKRHLQDLLGKKQFSSGAAQPLPHVVSRHQSNIIKRAPGVVLEHQKNKETNIILACQKISGMVIHPGETFSFWRTVGKALERHGYQTGRVLHQKKLITGVGGGLCNLANTINLLVIHSPLTITEFHTHSDALAPDEGPRAPLSAGTSVAYNYVDYRFQNCTDQDFQLLVWCQDEVLFAELRSQRPLPLRYGLLEEDHHFRREGEHYYRCSQIYKVTTDGTTGDVLNKELLWNNHSQVMFDHKLIPPAQIR